MRLCELAYDLLKDLDYSFRDVTVRIGDEYHPVEKIEISHDSDVLDNGTIVIVVKDKESTNDCKRID